MRVVLVVLLVAACLALKIDVYSDKRCMQCVSFNQWMNNFLKEHHGIEVAKHDLAEVSERAEMVKRFNIVQLPSFLHQAPAVFVDGEVIPGPAFIIEYRIMLLLWQEQHAQLIRIVKQLIPALFFLIAGLHGPNLALSLVSLKKLDILAAVPIMLALIAVMWVSVAMHTLLPPFVVEFLPVAATGVAMMTALPHLLAAFGLGPRLTFLMYPPASMTRVESVPAAVAYRLCCSIPYLAAAVLVIGDLTTLTAVCSLAGFFAPALALISVPAATVVRHASAIDLAIVGLLAVAAACAVGTM
ncbi:hypothetical protein J8273_1311 [Carpediemonas membranifera]|uniref:Uncharacterized protein n=1 Tax=Carpediemonas membranifera TaxID=201153 RepID=A0A8J6B6Z2_9EUKA|nr:hypothetical protein J8273_1311 [Carpediemonas membranifera]|eukprot:KAG9396963.1 hypothetical protein J8273_1311 [Carpediemonas membranifera]